MTMLTTRSRKKCPYCQTTIQQETEVVSCSACHLTYHKECWEENGGCASYGCCGEVSSEAPSVATGTIVVEVDEASPQAKATPETTPVRSRPHFDARMLRHTLGFICGITGFLLGLGTGWFGGLLGAVGGVVLGLFCTEFMIYGLVLALPMFLGLWIGAKGGDWLSTLGGFLGLGLGVLLLARDMVKLPE